MRPNIIHLPLDAASRAKSLVERSAPDPKRPKLDADLEERLADVEKRSAACYAEAEELAHQIRLAASDLVGEDLTDPGQLAAGARPGPIRNPPR